MSCKAGDIYKNYRKSHGLPKEGALQVWWVPQVPGRNLFEWPVKDIDEAKVLLRALAAYDDFQFAENVKGDYANAGGLEQFVDGEWEDWEDEYCDSIDDIMREENQ